MTRDFISIALGIILLHSSGLGSNDLYIVKLSLKCSLPYPDFIPITLNLMSVFLQVSFDSLNIEEAPLFFNLFL